jgi:protoheme IX farnesyltransferase
MFFWQHPHFYAIAFMCKEDYERANLKMLPVLETDGKRTNRQIIWHSLLLIPVSLMPSYIGLLGMTYFWGALILGIGYLVSGFPLIKNYSLQNAKLLLKSSVIYLPALFLIIILDKLT